MLVYDDRESVIENTGGSVRPDEDGPRRCFARREKSILLKDVAGLVLARNAERYVTGEDSADRESSVRGGMAELPKELGSESRSQATGFGNHRSPSSAAPVGSVTRPSMTAGLVKCGDHACSGSVESSSAHFALAPSPASAMSS